MLVLEYGDNSDESDHAPPPSKRQIIKFGIFEQGYL